MFYEEIEKTVTKRFWANGLREARQETGVSLRELAKKIGISPAFLSKVETGKQFVNESTHKNICSALNNVK